MSDLKSRQSRNCGVYWRQKKFVYDDALQITKVFYFCHLDDNNLTSKLFVSSNSSERIRQRTNSLAKEPPGKCSESGACELLFGVNALSSDTSCFISHLREYALSNKESFFLNNFWQHVHPVCGLLFNLQSTWIYVIQSVHMCAL